MDQQGPKQQIVDRIKQAENILVTVSANPSVDQLASCIGLTLLLNKMNKSATAVFSGKVPSTLEFLQPEKTLQNTTDSLRDFIISLDKAKADKLRYKIEDQVVRIFITPYRTKLTAKDLQYSEGDFNVEVIITLGVSDRQSLDDAILAHGRILHDATVISLSAGQGKAPDLGQINWQDPSASSLGEMLVSLSEAFGPNLIDNQTATAFLTGIVAETDRFSNSKTSPKVMTMSAQLMAAGANQQLVISKLQPPPVVPPVVQKPKPEPPKPEPPKPKQTPPVVQKPKPEPPKPEPPKPKQEPKKDAGLLNVAHDSSSSDGDEVEINTSEIHIDQQGNLKLIDKEDKNKKDNALNDLQVQKTDKDSIDNTEEKKPDAPKEPKTPPESLPPLPPPPSPKESKPIPPPPIPVQKPPEVIPPPPIPKTDMPLPPPVPPKVQELPPLPPPEPINPPKVDTPLPPHISAQGAAPQGSPLPPPPIDGAPATHSNHAVLDPLSQPHMGVSFSADTNNGWGGGASNLPVDPVNNIPMNPAGSTSFGQAKKVAPPPPDPGALTPESARQAVENAFNSMPFDPAHNPREDHGAQSIGPELHPPAYENGTPSLNLPGVEGAAPDMPPPPPNPPGPGAPPPPAPPPFLPPPSL
jgi:hypothetical protein